MFDLDEEGQRALIAEAEREFRCMCDAFHLPYSEAYAIYQQDRDKPNTPPVLYTYVAPDNARVVTYTTNTIRIRLADTAGEYHADTMSEFERILGPGVQQFPPSVQLMLFIFANDMTPRERATMSALLWDDPHPELAGAMAECWERFQAGTDRKFGVILRGYLCSSIFDKRSVVLGLVQTSPSAVHFWGEIGRLSPQWTVFLPDIVANATYVYTRVLHMMIRDVTQDGLDGLDGPSGPDGSQFTVIDERIDILLNGKRMGQVPIERLRSG